MQAMMNLDPLNYLLMAASLAEAAYPISRHNWVFSAEVMEK